MIIESANSKVQLCNDISNDINDFIKGYLPSQIFILTDTNTRKLCAGLLLENPTLKEAHITIIKPGDENKNTDALLDVWKFLTHNGADRHSLFINLGGGMLTDLGGFAASTFKRGIRFINIPTTLLAIVDAAVGGKTGINFEGFKNEIGVINHADAVLVDTRFLATLDRQNFLSGFAEMIKHALLSSEEEWNEIRNFNTSKPDFELLKPIVARSIAIKERIVAEDPYEKGIRKALNLGHTIGHAFESFAMERKAPVLHGYAVAWGTVCELYLSHKILGFPKNLLKEVTYMVSRNYGAFEFSCDDYDRLYELMTHDKKNKDGKINFTLLRHIGEIEINQHCKRNYVELSLDFLRDATGL